MRLPPTLPLVLSGLLAAPSVAQRSLALEQLRTDLLSANEAPVHAAARALMKENSVPAVEILLEVLNETERRSRRHLAAAHYRDIVWDALVGITDPYARKRVEQELRSNRDNARVRQWCAELLGIYGDQAFGSSLLRALRDRDEGVVRWAARSLGMLEYAEAQRPLQRVSRDRNPYVRANAVEALARIDLETNRDAFLDAVRDDRDGGVRCALLAAVPEVLPEECETLSVELLLDEDWRPRMQAVDNLRGIRTKTAVDALVRALDDGRPAVAVAALESLQELTGQPIRQAEVWRKWWPENRETFDFPETSGERKGVEEGRTVVYNGILLTSDHVAFLIDKSHAMNERLTSRATSKDEAASQELLRVLEALEGELVFNVHKYHTEIESLARKPTELGDRVVEKVRKFVASEPEPKPKDIWQALETVIADPTLDTAYLLSSGEPDVGLYVHWNRVTRHLKDLNRFHKVTIHTIAYSDNDWYRTQLEKIAEATGGQFQWFQ